MLTIVISGKPGAYRAILSDRHGIAFVKITRPTRDALIEEIEFLTTDV